MNQQLDALGEAREALRAAVTVYGYRVLSDPRILGNFMADQIPDLPREQSLIVTGAEAGIAAEITQRVREQHLDPDTAVQLAARSLVDGKAIDPAASLWIAAEYAQVLGYPVRAAGSLPAPPPVRDPERTLTTHVPYPAPAPEPAPAPAPAPAPRKRNKGLLYGGAAVAAAIVIAAVFAFIPSPKPTPKQHVPPAPSPVPSPTPTPTPTPGLASLTSLLPSDIDDPSTQCHAQTPPFNWAMPGLVQALTCTDPGLPSGYVYAYQVKTAADFRTTWANYNKWWGFAGASAGSSCPPGDGPGDHGTTSWHDNYFPARDGQVVECEWVGSGSTPNEPAYTWTFPTENTFIVGQGAANSTFSALQTWWTDNSSPLTSPTPAS